MKTTAAQRFRSMLFCVYGCFFLVLSVSLPSPFRARAVVNGSIDYTRTSPSACLTLHHPAAWLRLPVRPHRLLIPQRAS